MGNRALPDRPTGGAFYLHGDDHFRKEQALRALIDLHVDPATRDFNLDRLRGGDVDAETLSSVVATPPMMAEWRVVVLREAEGMAGSKHAREALLSAMRDPPPGLALLVSCTVPEKSKAAFYRDLQKSAQALEFVPMTDADLPGWLIKRAREVHGLEVEIDAARALGTAIGSELGVLERELEKLADYVGPGRAVTLVDIEASGTRLPAQDRWKWLDLVGQRRFPEALAGLTALVRQGESGVALVIALTTHLLRIGVVLESGRAGLEQALPPYQRWLARSVVPQARGWSTGELNAALVGLREVDHSMKSSAHDADHFLESWLLGLQVRSEAA